MTQQIIDSGVNFDENSEGLVIERYQAIPQKFLDSLKAERYDNKAAKAGEYHRVASIPVVIVEKWQREGFDFQNAPIKEILLKLKMEGLDAFITSDKAL